MLKGLNAILSMAEPLAQACKAGGQRGKDDPTVMELEARFIFSPKKNGIQVNRYEHGVSANHFGHLLAGIARDPAWVDVGQTETTESSRKEGPGHSIRKTEEKGRAPVYMHKIKDLSIPAVDFDVWHEKGHAGTFRIGLAAERECTREEADIASKQVYKDVRIKERYSYLNGNRFRLDLTKVREGKDVRTAQSAQYRYEVELELVDHNYIQSVSNVKEVLFKMVNKLISLLPKQYKYYCALPPPPLTLAIQYPFRNRDGDIRLFVNDPQRGLVEIATVQQGHPKLEHMLLSCGRDPKNIIALFVVYSPEMSSFLVVERCDNVNERYSTMPEVLAAMEKQICYQGLK